MYAAWCPAIQDTFLILRMVSTENACTSPNLMFVLHLANACLPPRPTRRQGIQQRELPRTIQQLRFAKPTVALVILLVIPIQPDMNATETLKQGKQAQLSEGTTVFG